jgi:hypothetical protein
VAAFDIPGGKDKKFKNKFKKKTVYVIPYNKS